MKFKLHNTEETDIPELEHFATMNLQETTELGFALFPNDPAIREQLIDLSLQHFVAVCELLATQGMLQEAEVSALKAETLSK